MKNANISLYRTALRSSTVLVAAAALAAPAFAQEQEAQEAQETAAEEVIIVTGSLITNPNLERSAPVNVTTADEIELKQINVAEDLLREIPGLVPSIGSSVNNGNGGASYVDLRGLGSNRNIVLLDGNRLTPSNFVGRVDLNNVPVALVERVDVLTGGASTTYGADAVTGVVNFITKRDFAGFEAQVGNSITEKGDGNYFRADFTVGANFDDGRGNAVLSIGYQEADPVYQGARAVSIEAIDSFSGGSGGSSTTVPSAFSFSGGGLPANDARRLTGNRQVIPGTGQVNPQFDGVGSTGLPGVYSAFNFAPFNIFQTPFERFNIFGSARYEISDAVEVYTRGMFSKNTVNTIIAPSGAFGLSVQIPVSNPFLPAGLRTQFCNNNDFDAVTAGIQTLTPAQCAAAAVATSPSDPNYRTFQTNLRRRTVEVGSRISEYVTTFFDYTLGFRGAVTDTINWDIQGSYGESENRQTLQNYASSTRVRDALLATNTNSCLGANAACVPLNVFGPAGSMTSAMADYLRVPSFSLNLTSLAQLRGTLNGDFGASLPWAEDAINFAVGAEYRSYGAIQTSDLLASTPGELGGAGGAAPEVDGGYDVYEAVAEIVVPLVQGKPFFENLSLEAGVRYSDYSVRAPGSPAYDAWTYKVGGTWDTGGGLTFRGNYSRAVRAPNIGELFVPQTVGLTNLSLDPCQLALPVGNANLTAVCRAQGAPASSIGSIQVPTAGQANATFGGNLNLKPEKADTYTLGFVFQPEFVPGLALSMDYYNIKVADAVSSLTPDDAIDACFGNLTAASASDPACTSIGRDPGTGELNSDPATTSGLFLPLSNAGKLATDGIDLNINWKGDIGFAELALSFVGNYTFSSTFKASPGSINRECVGYYSINCTSTGSLAPQFGWSQRTTLSFESFDVSLAWRHLDAVKQEPLDADPVTGQGPAFEGDVPGSNFGIVNAGRIGAYNYFDLAVRFNLTDNFTLTASVENLLNKKPPFVGSSIGSTTFNSGNTYPSTYDTMGRKYGVSLRTKF